MTIPICRQDCAGVPGVPRPVTQWSAAIAFLVLWHAPALAGPPFCTDDPEPVAYQHWEMLLFSQGAHIPGSTTAVLPGYEVNYGALPNLQLHAILPLSYSMTGNGRPGFGGGDLELGAKYQFLTPGDGDWFPEAGIFPTIEVPSGNRAFSSSTGHLQVYLPLWLQKDLGPWSVYGGGGYWINPGLGHKNYWFVGAALWRKMSNASISGLRCSIRRPASQGASLGPAPIQA